MDRFAQETEQSVHLVVPELGQSYVVAQASSQSVWEFRLRLGARLDLFDTGSGQTLLSFMTQDQQSHAITMRGEATPKIEKDLSHELAQIRADGHRVRASQQLAGVTDITVPILSPNGIAVGVLTCPFLPMVKSNESTIEEQIANCLTALKKTAQGIA